jgi:hypothetical protein
MTFEVLDPTPEFKPEGGDIAPRLATLEGKTIGLLDNGKVRVGRFYDFVEEILTKDYAVRGVMRRDKRGASSPMSTELLEEMLTCDAVLSAVGD